MNSILEEKKQNVVALLIHWISSKKVDYEKCLNAHFILVELADHETTYGKLVQRDNLTALVRGACDFKNPYQAYALNVLTTIIREFPNFERQIGQLAAEFQQVIGTNFLDLTYSCLMMIRSPDSTIGENDDYLPNAFGSQTRKFGQKRLKALELIQQEL